VIRAIDLCPEVLLRRRLASGSYRFDTDGELEKRCARCMDYWPADEEFFYTGRAYPDGLHCFCKACYVEKRFPEGRSGTLHHIQT
jgi:hypothetical protein